MLSKILPQVSLGSLMVSLLSLGAIGSSQPVAAQTSTFYCDTNSEGIPTTYVRRAGGSPDPLIRWRRNWGSEYTPERRCQIVSQNFQAAIEQELYQFTYAKVNRQNVICAAKEAGGDCAQTLFTLKPEDDPRQVMESLIEGGYVSSGFITQSQGESQQRYYDIRLFLSDPPRPTEQPADL